MITYILLQPTASRDGPLPCPPAHRRLPARLLCHRGGAVPAAALPGRGGGPATAAPSCRCATAAAPVPGCPRPGGYQQQQQQPQKEGQGRGRGHGGGADNDELGAATVQYM